jgi:protein arginine N-methyltransferase 7
MTDWSKELGEALASREPERMRQALSQVPSWAMRQAIPALERMADDCEREGHPEEALLYRDCIVDAAPERDAARKARATLRLRLGLYREALDDARRSLSAEKDDPEALRIVGAAHEALGDADEALSAYRRSLALSPEPALAERVRALGERQRTAEALRRNFDPTAAQPEAEADPPPKPAMRFDPALRDDPTLPADAESFRVDGVARLLQRYSNQSAPRSAIARLQDPLWREAWDGALATLAGERVRFVGSELGVFALRALQHGAAHALCVERHPLDARIAAGMAQKHFLGAWHARHGDAIRDWSEEQRRASFEAFAEAVDVAVAGEPGAEDGNAAVCDTVVFPGIDHTLLGTGIVPRTRACRRADGSPARMLPSHARLYAMAIQWRHPGDHDLHAIDRLRWSAYPQPLPPDPELWIAITAPIEVGEIAFAAFAESTREYETPALRDGKVDAIVVWFELELDDARLSTAPDGALRCLRPAVHGADGLDVTAGAPVRLHIAIHETRLHARTVPPPTRTHAQGLPPWYLAMLGDVRRNRAYRDALRTAVERAPVTLALDIGAGTGLLSMLAAEAGVRQVIGCERLPAIAAVGRDTLRANGHDGRVALIAKDWRALQVPDDLPERADLAVFELFDCSLIGEGILHALAHARTYLLSADARYVPAGARLRAMIVEYRLDRPLGIDANLLNPYLASPEFVNVDSRTLDYRPLTDAFDLFAFDFATAGPEPGEAHVDPIAIADGIAGAVLFWFDLRLDDDIGLSNAPDGDPTHWKQGLQFLPEARVEAGLALPLHVRHNGSALQMRWRQDALPAERFSRLPRLDPQWLKASQDLEQQTQQLLQHCARNPDEYRKVAAIAQRMAVDPARFDLDPAIAERFMQLFLNEGD